MATNTSIGWKGAINHIGTWYEVLAPPFPGLLLEIGNIFCFGGIQRILRWMPGGRHTPGCVHYISVWNVFLLIFSCYMPTSWEPNHEAEQMYELLELLLSNCECLGASAVVGGDFNAMLGDPCEGMTQIFLELVDSDGEMTEDG